MNLNFFKKITYSPNRNRFDIYGWYENKKLSDDDFKSHIDSVDSLEEVQFKYPTAQLLVIYETHIPIIGLL